MSGDAHRIDIESIAVSRVGLRNAERLRALIESGIRRALAGSDLRASASLSSNEPRIAGEVARAVARSIQRGRHGD